MADLTSAGRVQSKVEIRDLRQRNGLCGTCQNDYPVQCYTIKKRLFSKERIPLTEEGKVYNGICLKCNPQHDPRIRPHQPARTDHLTSNVAFERDARDSRDQIQDHRRKTDPLWGNAQQGDELPHSASMPIGILRKPPTRQANFRLPKTVQLDVGEKDNPRQHHLHLPRFAYDPRGHQQQQQHHEQDYADEIERGNWGNPKPHTAAGHTDQDANLSNQYSNKNDNSPYRHYHTAQQSYEQNSEYNVRFPNYSPQYSPSQPSGRVMISSDGVHRNIPYAQDSQHNRSAYDHQRGGMEDRKLPGVPNSNLEDNVQPDRSHPRDTDHYLSAFHQRRGGEMEDRKLLSVPDPLRRGDFSYFNLEDNVQHDSHHLRDSDRNRSGHEYRGGDGIDDRRPSVPNLTNRIDSSSYSADPEMDNLQRVIAYHISGPRRFVPCSSGVVPPNAELLLDDIGDDPSVLTQDTYLREVGSVATMETRKKAASRRTLGAIDESSSSSSSRKSMISHRIHEPAIPHAAAVPSQEMGSYLNNATPNLKNLSEFIEMYNTTGLDDEAINTLKMALIHDNGTTRSKDLAKFCLIKLLVLARKSDDNKRMMIVDDIDGAGAYSAFDAIIEAAQIYSGSAEIQQEVCAVLWSLSIKHQKHIAEKGGCKAILDAMKIHMEDDILQERALGALKVISLDLVGRLALFLQGGMAIVTDVMKTHVYNPAIQSRGCVILGKLMVDEAEQSTILVGGKEVDVIIKGMLAHPDSLEVQEAACFTLISLTSSAANVALINHNCDIYMAKLSLQLALENHRSEVGAMVSTLWRRLFV